MNRFMVMVAKVIALVFSVGFLVLFSVLAFTVSAWFLTLVAVFVLATILIVFNGKFPASRFK